MERIRITFTDASFDEAVHAPNALPECADMAFCVKSKATVGGNAAVCINWTARLPDGSYAKAQAVTTVKAFISAAKAIESHLTSDV